LNNILEMLAKYEEEVVVVAFLLTMTRLTSQNQLSRHGKRLILKYAGNFHDIDSLVQEMNRVIENFN